jgi:hypothetical protein
MPGSIRVAALAMALHAVAGSASAAGFDEFENPTLDFDRVHTLPANTRICRDAEAPDRPMERCYRLKGAARVKILAPIHGITRPDFLVRPLDEKLAQGFVFREDIPD